MGNKESITIDEIVNENVVDCKKIKNSYLVN